MSGNCRPVQPLNGRLVRRNFNQPQATGTRTTPAASPTPTMDYTSTTSPTIDKTTVRICSAGTQLTAMVAVLPTLLIILGKVIDYN